MQFSDIEIRSLNVLSFEELYTIHCKRSGIIPSSGKISSPGMELLNPAAVIFHNWRFPRTKEEKA